MGRLASPTRCSTRVIRRTFLIRPSLRMPSGSRVLLMRKAFVLQRLPSRKVVHHRSPDLSEDAPVGEEFTAAIISDKFFSSPVYSES